MAGFASSIVLFLSVSLGLGEVTPACLGSGDGLRVALALDCSGSIGNDAWSSSVSFAKRFVESLKEKAPESEVAVVFFSDTSNVITDFEEDTQTILISLDQPRCAGGSLFPSAVFTLFEASNSSTRTTLLLVTDGDLNNGPTDATQLLKQKGATIFTIGVGSSISQPALQAMASEPATSFSKTMTEFDDLPLLIGGIVSTMLDSTIRFSPRHAPQIGGVHVFVAVPRACLVSYQSLRCHFGNESSDVDVVQGHLRCISPVVRDYGFVSFAVEVVFESRTSLILKSAQQFEVTEALPMKESALPYDIQSNGIATVSWAKFIMGSHFVVDTVDIQLIRLAHNGSQLESYNLALDVPNSGQWTGSVGPSLLEFEGLEFVRIGQARNGVVPFSEGLVLRQNDLPYWSGIRERRMNRRTKRETMTSDERCNEWFEKEADMTWYEEIEDIACPPTAQQAMLDINFAIDPACCDFDLGCGLWSEVSWVLQSVGMSKASSEELFRRISVNCSEFHPGADHCMRSDKSGARQQCCYSKNSLGRYDLITEGTGRGTADKKSFIAHYFEDVKPWKLCCKGRMDSPDCQKYYLRRPTRDSSGYPRRAAAGGFGEPHFLTLDGFRYTFNGHGEFVLVRSKDFEIQVRLEKMNEQATKTTAVAVEFVCGKGRIAVAVHTDESGMGRILVNEELFQADGRYRYVYKYSCGADAKKVVLIPDTSKVEIQGPDLSLSVDVQKGIMSYVVVLSESLRGNVEGLLGQWNGNDVDDLVPRDSLEPISPPPTNLSEIHYRFGMTWNIRSENESLFVYLTGESFSSINDKNFVPVFEIPPIEDAAFAAKVNETCGSSFECRFDVVVTGDIEIGNMSFKFNDTIELSRSPESSASSVSRSASSVSRSASSLSTQLLFLVAQMLSSLLLNGIK